MSTQPEDRASSDMSDFLRQFSAIELNDRQQRLLPIQEHMRKTIDDYALLFAETCHGFSLLHDHLTSRHGALLKQLSDLFSPQEAERQYKIISQLLVAYEFVPDAASAPAPHGTLQSFESDTSPNSAHIRILASSLLIALYQYWEHTWRPEIQQVIGSVVLDDFWGEVCKIRDCILHNKARANADYERRAKVLKWFKDGQTIEITPRMFAVFVVQARDYCDSFIANLA